MQKWNNKIIFQLACLFIPNKTKHKHFYRHFLQCFSSSKVLSCHTKNCLEINQTKSGLIPEESAYINFQNFKRLTEAPVIIRGNFECVLILSTDNIGFVPNNKKYQVHMVCSYGYKLICVDECYS